MCTELSKVLTWRERLPNLIMTLFFFLCGHISPPSGENAVGFSFKKKRYSFYKILNIKKGIIYNIYKVVSKFKLFHFNICGISKEEV